MSGKRSGIDNPLSRTSSRPGEYFSKQKSLKADHIEEVPIDEPNIATSNFHQYVQTIEKQNEQQANPSRYPAMSRRASVRAAEDSKKVTGGSYSNLEWLSRVDRDRSLSQPELESQMRLLETEEVRQQKLVKKRVSRSDSRGPRFFSDNPMRADSSHSKSEHPQAVQPQTIADNPMTERASFPTLLPEASRSAVDLYNLAAQAYATSFSSVSGHDAIHPEPRKTHGSLERQNAFYGRNKPEDGVISPAEIDAELTDIPKENFYIESDRPNSAAPSHGRIYPDPNATPTTLATNSSPESMQSSELHLDASEYRAAEPVSAENHTPFRDVSDRFSTDDSSFEVDERAVATQRELNTAFVASDLEMQEIDPLDLPLPPWPPAQHRRACSIFGPLESVVQQQSMMPPPPPVAMCARAAASIDVTSDIDSLSVARSASSSSTLSDTTPPPVPSVIELNRVDGSSPDSAAAERSRSDVNIAKLFELLEQIKQQTAHRAVRPDPVERDISWQEDLDQEVKIKPVKPKAIIEEAKEVPLETAKKTEPASTVIDTEIAELLEQIKQRESSDIVETKTEAAPELKDELPAQGYNYIAPAVAYNFSYPAQIGAVRAFAAPAIAATAIPQNIAQLNKPEQVAKDHKFEVSAPRSRPVLQQYGYAVSNVAGVNIPVKAETSQKLDSKVLAAGGVTSAGMGSAAIVTGVLLASPAVAIILGVLSGATALATGSKLVSAQRSEVSFADRIANERSFASAELGA